jgi:hypothetical protein
MRESNVGGLGSYATAARDRKPSRPPLIIVATTGWAIAGRFPGAGGRPLRRRRGMMPIYGRQRLRGTASPPGPHRSSLPRPDGPLLSRFPGGRPLRRRRAMMPIYGRQRLRGTASPQAPTDHRCHDRMGHCRPIPWRASAPWNGVDLRPATAARDRSPPGHRSSLPRPDGLLPADSLEGVRSVGAVQ